MHTTAFKPSKGALLKKQRRHERQAARAVARTIKQAYNSIAISNFLRAALPPSPAALLPDNDRLVDCYEICAPALSLAGRREGV